jgi:hypothetical protein
MLDTKTEATLGKCNIRISIANSLEVVKGRIRELKNF